MKAKIRVIDGSSSVLKFLNLRAYDSIQLYEPKEAYSRKSKGPRDRYGRVK